jgi:hypothetical protein
VETLKRKPSSVFSPTGLCPIRVSVFLKNHKRARTSSCLTTKEAPKTRPFTTAKEKLVFFLKYGIKGFFRKLEKCQERAQFAGKALLLD